MLQYIANQLRKRFASPSQPVAASSDAVGVPAEVVDFICNVCGRRNPGRPLIEIQNREFQSCVHCHSSLRMRSLIHALAMELYGQSLPLSDFKSDKTVSGLGMSDWEGYANRLAELFSYTNTYYHADPHLDITEIPQALAGTQRFLISSDVFEHIPVFALDRAFANSRRLLCDGGFFLFSVPFAKEGGTHEHFPNLHDFRIIETGMKRFLYNKTVDGREEIFDNLVFHGGEGMTLEMRMFSEPDLIRRLNKAGFSSVRICTDRVPEYGILWPMDWAVPIVARA